MNCACSLSHGKLAATLQTPGDGVSVAISPPTLIEGKSLVKMVQQLIKFNQKHKKHKLLILTVRVLVADTTGKPTLLLLKINVS